MLLWILLGLALVLAVLSLRGDGARLRYVEAQLARQLADDACPPATVIVPVKGADEGLARNLAALAAQDYPDFELLVAVESPSDLPPGALPAGARLIAAGEATAEAGKIHNLLAAVAAARPESQILAFADSDGEPGVQWLRALAAPLADAGVGASTGYRWHVPERGGVWPLLRSAWNAVIAGGFGPGNNAFVWGGAMAVRRETFGAARVADYWRGAVSDDFRLAEAVHRAGLAIAYAPGALVPARDHVTAGEFFEWIARQMKITRAYRPRLWWLALVSHCLYCGAMVAAVAAHQWPALAAQLGLGMVKGARRAALARRCLAPRDDVWFARHGWVYTFCTPLVTWIWLYALLASAWSRRIEWRGREYVLRHPGQPPAPMR
ncbi:MAG: glycosyltransferase [Bryobacterales bacterium]|nr:glycosyltransferase [Bryobacterales bacterium]